MTTLTPAQWNSFWITLLSDIDEANDDVGPGHMVTMQVYQQSDGRLGSAR